MKQGNGYKSCRNRESEPSRCLQIECVLFLCFLCVVLPVYVRLVPPAVLLLESFGYRGVGDVDLVIDRTGGGKLLPGVRRIQVPPQVR